MPNMTEHEYGSFCWVDLSTTDPAAAKEFYSPLLGWEYEEQYFEGNLIYSMATSNGRLVGGLGQLQPDQLEAGMRPAWSSYVCVEDAEATVTRCQELGATVLQPPMQVFDSGVLAALMAPGGAPFCMWQPKAHKGMQVYMEPGAFSWTELYARDPEQDAEFYKNVFGWGLEKDQHPDNTGYYRFTRDLPEDAEPWQRYVAGLLTIQPEMGEVPPHWNVYFQVADVATSLSRALELGATQLHDLMDVPMVKLVGLCDPQGAVFTLMQMQPME